MRRLYPRSLKILLACACLPAVLSGQRPTMDQVLERLDKLEQENRTLRRQVEELRADVEALRGAPAAETLSLGRLEERLEVQERRVDEQAQTKVEASQKFPIRLTGFLVANLFRNGPHSGGLDTPVSVSRASGRRTAGFTFRQSVLGMEYRGGQTVLGGHVRGSVFMDFFDGLAELNNFAPMRVRTASVAVDWGTRSLVLAQDKPLISVRDPASFSYIGVSPLTGSGNLWRWQPQIRFEQRIGVGRTRLRAQGALYQTSEEAGTETTPRVTFDRRRPGLEGRFAFEHRLEGERRLELAPAFHISTSRVGGVPVPSRLFSLDWFANPWEHLEFSGVFFAGRNISHFGATRQGWTVRAPGRVIPVHARGGWAQLSAPFTPRVTLNLFGGVHDDRNRDLAATGIAGNRTGAANVMYRAAPNVIVTLEAMQQRTTHLGTGSFKNNRYDLSVVYLF